MSVNNNKPKKCSKLILLRNIIFGVSFVFVASINDSPTKNKKRTPSSIQPIQLEKNSFLKNPLVKHTKKLSIPFVTSIKSDLATINEGETVTLTGFLQSKSTMKNIQATWVIPASYTIVSGSKKSYLSTVEAGADYQFEITLKSNTDINEIIYLVAEAIDGESQFSNSSQFHTQLQTELNEANKELFKRSQEYIQGNN